MNASTRKVVRERADYRCEYCHLPELATPFLSFHLEHVIAQQHQVDDTLNNLALACDRCNAFKGPNLSSIDPASKKIVQLFNPRTDTWDDHFRLDAGLIIGLTPTGRATAKLLTMNAPRRVELRREMLGDR